MEIPVVIDNEFYYCLNIKVDSLFPPSTVEKLDYRPS